MSDTGDEKPRAYEVGYGKPPKHTQFRKGESGNPKGRPKGLRNLKTDLAEELGEHITVKENGRVVTHTKQRLVLKALTAKALKGDARAGEILIRLIGQHLGLDGEDADDPSLAADDLAILDAFRERGAP